MNKTLLTSAIVLALGSTSAQAVTTTGNNFSMQAFGGTNDVTFSWDETFNTTIAGATSNATISSPTSFFGHLWTAHDVTIYGPGTYIFSTACPAGKADCVGGIVTYIPPKNFVGTDSFTYTVADSNGGTTMGTVNVTVNPVNDAPTTAKDFITTSEGVPVTMDPRPNDSDLEGHAFTITDIFDYMPSFFGPPIIITLGGTLSFDANSVTYTPNAGFTGVDQFRYEVTDVNGGVATEFVTVAVNAIGNTLPAANPDSGAGDEGIAFNIPVLANDSDADGDSLSIVSVTPGVNGIVSIAGSNARYKGNKGFNGSDSFTYVAHDGKGGTVTALVTVTVNPRNDKPQASTDLLIAQQDTATTIDPLSNDSDLDGDALTVTAVDTTNTVGGSVSFTANSVTYTPNTGFSGQDRFDYTIDDGNGGTSTGRVTVAVNATGNSLPVAINDTLIMDEDTVGKAYVLDNGDSDVEDAKLSNIISSSGNTEIFLDAPLTITVDLGQVAGHMLFDWSGNLDIDLVNVWDMDSLFGDGSTMVNCVTFPGQDCGKTTTDPWSGNPLTVWDGASTDDNNNGQLGVPFVDGPFPGVHGNFNLMGLHDDASNNQCPGDFDLDGDVDGSDVSVIIPQIGRTDCSVATPCSADFDGDGDVDGGDIATFVQDLGKTSCETPS